MEIRDFLKTGILNGIHRGMHLTEVLKLVPSMTFVEQLDEVKISDSEVFEFTLQNDIVIGIVISVNAFEPIIVEKRGTTCMQVEVKTTLDELCKMLGELNISWKFLPRWTFNHQLALETEGDVDFLFDYSDGRSWLGKIGCWQR